MMLFPAILLIIGLALKAYGRKIKADIQILESNFLGDLLPDAEKEAMYLYEIKIKTSTLKACSLMGSLFILWSILFSFAILLD